MILNRFSLSPRDLPHSAILVKALAGLAQHATLPCRALLIPALRYRALQHRTRHHTGWCTGFVISLIMAVSPLAAPAAAPSHPGGTAMLWGSDTPVPTTAAGIRKARAARVNLQQLLARKARLLQQKEEEARQAEARAHLSARQLAHLREKQDALARQHAAVETRLTRLAAQLSQLNDGEETLQNREKALLQDEASRLPALHQLAATPELTLLMPPANPGLSPTLPLALLALRHQQNQQAMAEIHLQQARLHRQQDQLTDQSRNATEQESRLLDSQTQATNLTAEAEKQSEAAQQALLRQQALLTQARQSTEALTGIITALARQEAESRRRLQAEKARLHHLHQRRREQELEQKARSLSPGKGLLRGKARPPVQGRLVTRWAQPTEAGPATGLTYQTAPSAPVTAPCTGQMLYSVVFRSFGPMVILDCGQRQRLVLAGLGTIHLQSGAPVQRGGLIGQMPARDPLLFVQLRHGTQLVDPARFF